MTGYEKIAILLGELGSSASDAILDRLNLSTEELSKIRKAMLQVRSYGERAYDPFDPNQVNRELAVLEEFKRYGEMRGIYKEVPHDGLIKTSDSANQNFRSMAQADPEAFAKALGVWLSSDK